MPHSETRIVLIRHGESQSQVSGMITGHDSCKGLSDLGRLQAEALRDRLAATGELADAEEVYTSVLARAVETAQIAFPAAAGATGVRSECDWCEMHPGEGEGVLWEDFRARFRPDQLDDPFWRRCPGMETWGETFVRIGARLRRAAAEHEGGLVVVVTHAGAVGASFVALGGFPIQVGRQLFRECLNTSLTEWAGSGSDWRLLRYNDAAHAFNVRIDGAK